jgi:hypothetical protein
MLPDAKLTPNAKRLLWSHAMERNGWNAMDTATILDNLLPRKGSTTNAYEMWGEQAPVDSKDLNEWGRVAYITKRDKIKTKQTPKAVKCILSATQCLTALTLTISIAQQQIESSFLAM